MAYPDVIPGVPWNSPSSKKMVIAISAGYEDRKAPMNRYRSEKKGIEESVRCGSDNIMDVEIPMNRFFISMSESGMRR